MTLAWILVASVAGGTLSAGLAALALTLRATWIPMLVSFAIGALLGAAFLEIIPHAFEEGEAHQVAFSILGGIFGFFVLEKLLLYRHCHTEHCEVHDAHDHGRSGTLIVVGDTVHNFVDGVLIAAAFLQSTELGVVAAVAIIAHEIPQEVGDFLILLHSGYSRARALALNLLSSTAHPARRGRRQHDLRCRRRPDPRAASPSGAARHRVPGPADRARNWDHRGGRCRGAALGKRDYSVKGLRII
jgi:zinc and cadmium transporter